MWRYPVSTFLDLKVAVEYYEFGAQSKKATILSFLAGMQKFYLCAVLGGCVFSLLALVNWYFVTKTSMQDSRFSH